MIEKFPKPHRPWQLDRIFWDIDVEKIDVESKKSFIIERVFTRGDVEDIRMCRRYYGDKKISAVLLNAKFLPIKKLYLASAVINKPIEDFRCYKQRQLMKGHLPY